jgi:peptidoglycan/LPS O-acetylase OafA/YrhL
MRDIRVIFFLHIAFASGIQFLSRARHHAVGMFYHQDTVTFAMQALTLCLVYAVFALFVAGPRVSGGRSRTLRFLGDVSYPLYLMHTPVYVLLANTRLNMGPWAPLAYYGIALAVSAAVYWSVDLYSKRRHLQLGTA